MPIEGSSVDQATRDRAQLPARHKVLNLPRSHAELLGDIFDRHEVHTDMFAFANLSVNALKAVQLAAHNS